MFTRNIFIAVTLSLSLVSLVAAPSVTLANDDAATINQLTYLPAVCTGPIEVEVIGISYPPSGPNKSTTLFLQSGNGPFFPACDGGNLETGKRCIVDASESETLTLKVSIDFVDIDQRQMQQPLPALTNFAGSFLQSGDIVSGIVAGMDSGGPTESSYGGTTISQQSGSQQSGPSPLAVLLAPYASDEGELELPDDVQVLGLELDQILPGQQQSEHQSVALAVKGSCTAQQEAALRANKRQAPGFFYQPL